MESLPWIKYLPEEEIREFLRDLRKTLNTTQHGPQFVLRSLDAELSSWKATAEVYADPELLAALTEATMEDFGEVKSPKDDLAEKVHKGLTKPGLDLSEWQLQVAIDAVMNEVFPGEARTND